MTGADIKALRERLGWTQAKLAEHLGIKQASVSRLEQNGWEPSGPVKLLLAQLAAQKPEAAENDDGASPNT